MAHRAERIQELRGLIGSDDLLGPDDPSVQRLADWFRSVVELREDGERLRNLSYAVVHDVSLHLGEALISRCRSLRWEMYTGSKKDPAYQKHVITGFTQVDNPKYRLDIDPLVVAFAYQVVDGDNPDEREFVRILQEAEHLA